MKKREQLALIRQHYPTAVTTIDSVNKLIDYMEEELDLEPAKVMLADSICSDDVNSIQYPIRAHEFLGPFKLGGLDGYPFAGVTGMGAFASHVPDDGAVYVYYGPHIGINKQGQIGSIHRFGQSDESDCCGAAKVALQQLQQQQIQPGMITDLDYQMNTIQQIFLRAADRICQAPAPLQEATQVMYEAIDQRIEQLIAATKYRCHYIILMGAILINSDRDMGSFNAIQKFDVIDLATGIRSNALPQLL